MMGVEIIALEGEMNVEFLAGLSGAVLSFLFSYIPGFNAWFDALEAIYKRIIMGALIVAVGAGSYGLVCAGFLSVVTCDNTGASAVVNAVLAALVANQAAYAITKG